MSEVVNCFICNDLFPIYAIVPISFIPNIV